jgi:hypothetical protein
MTLCNSGQANLIATRFKEQSIKEINESLDDKVNFETMRCEW